MITQLRSHGEAAPSVSTSADTAQKRSSAVSIAFDTSAPIPERSHISAGTATSLMEGMPLVPRDLVTRHERTLHAKSHNNEKIADEVTVACSLSTQATNHETPVSDDISDGEEIDLERQSYPESLEYQSPRNDVASSASSPITGRFEANFQTASPFGVEDRDVILEGIVQAESEPRLPGQRCDETSEECSNGSRRAQTQSSSPHTADPRPHQLEVLELDMIDPALFSDIGQEMDMDFGLPGPSANVPSHEPTEVLRQHVPGGTDQRTDRSVAMHNDPGSFVFSPNTMAELNLTAIEFASLTRQAGDISEDRLQVETGGLATSGFIGDYSPNSRKGAQAVVGPSSVPLQIKNPLPADGRAVVKDYALWTVQTRVLLSFFAIMSGDRELVNDTMRDNGFYTLVYSKARAAVAGGAPESDTMDWQLWIELESWKRLIGGIFIESTLTMVIYEVNPGFHATQDLDIPVYSDEILWNAGSPDDWRETYISIGTKKESRRHTIKDVLVDILLEGKYHANIMPYHVSPLTALVAVHALVVHMWQRFQDQECSLVFNCQAILRIAYTRIAGPSIRISLMNTDDADVDAAISSFVTAKMERSPQLLDIISKSFEGFKIPVKIGHLLVRKTAAFRWSVEHAVAGWSSAILVSKWVYSIEIGVFAGIQPTAAESKLLTIIREALEEAECELSEASCLSAAVAKTWGWFMHDVWIWGITPRMGEALNRLAIACA
ncbi:hypothetical protein CGCS363_v010334 [Colletotrichum siamense]|uniref:uncharacterized protein n=1 Tax=Colletotrichum siamense TaxID=690259 RepID=UPI0018728AA1|nr:uncharacterized protein CGCS363_v010334 [Colletotrichum siamense]KAF5492252.1 hypothetical protein CGCS363_v010334 [Colletotrichum siamense]